RSGFHFDLRGEGVSGDRNETTFHRVPVYSYYMDRLSCRYNGKTIIDGMRKAGRPLDAFEEKAVLAVRELAMSEEFRLDMKFERGDIQLLSNHSVLHSRNAYEDWPEPERRRRLLRLWVQLYNGRPLDDDFADRNNTGPRRGIMQQKGVSHWVGP
ncbi:MAG: TauD/TfdA family dioxygenase, partial [Rhodospirillales bacterium]